MNKMDQYVVRMSAGLANRMLQYAYSLYLKKKGFEVFQDNTYKASEWKMEDIDWDRIFPHAPIIQASKWLIFKYGGGYDKISLIRSHYLPFLHKVCISPHAYSIPSEEDLKKYRFFRGIYMNAKMIEAVTDEVREAFQFSSFDKDSANFFLANKMKSENSVAIHVRKGKDYMKKQSTLNTCPVSYYEKAIALIKEKVKNPVFYIFTDNPDWVRENLTFFEYSMVEGNPTIGWGNHFDMQLQTYCKHNIIANSTYSWWGAFLNPNPNKIVIEPKVWFDISKYDNIENGSICSNWIAL